MLHKHLLVFSALALLSGCGNAIDCAINGDNLKGRVTFGNGVAIRSDANVVIQYSTSSFGSDSTSAAKTNPQGLLTVAYGFCVPSGTYQLRAFEDLNNNGALDAGEPAGRLDGTSTGDAAYVSKSVTQTSASDASSSSSSSDVRVTDADIVIDNP